MAVSTPLSENLSDAGFLRASHVVPWFPREDGVDPKSARRGEKTWDDSVGALKMLRKIGDFFHEVSRWTYIIFFYLHTHTLS